MGDIELGNVQERFADIVWKYEPVGSGELEKADDLHGAAKAVREGPASE